LVKSLSEKVDKFSSVW